MSTGDEKTYFVGFFISLLGHALLAVLIIFKFGAGLWGVPEPVVYSVTLEGGKKLGGIAQVPKKETKKVVPPKKVREKPKPKKEEPPDKDAEVKLPKEKEEKKEEKKATPAPTAKPKPKATPKPKPKPKKATPKPTPKKPTKADINKQWQNATQRYFGESTEAGGEGFGAGKLGGNSMGGGVVRPPEFFIYKRILEEHIKSGWRWHERRAGLIAVVEFKISTDGKLSDIKLAKRSSSREYDDSVMRAVYKASPVPIPPQKVYRYFASVRMTFDPTE